MINTIIEFYETDTSDAEYYPGENTPEITKTIIGELNEKEIDKIFSSIEKFKSKKIRKVDFAGVTGFPNLEQALEQDYNIGTAYFYNYPEEDLDIEHWAKKRLKKDKVFRIELIDDIKKFNTFVKKLKNEMTITYEYLFF